MLPCPWAPRPDWMEGLVPGSGRASARVWAPTAWGWGSAFPAGSVGVFGFLFPTPFSFRPLPPAQPSPIHPAPETSPLPRSPSAPLPPPPPPPPLMSISALLPMGRCCCRCCSPRGLWMLSAPCCDDRRMCVCPGPRRIGRYPLQDLRWVAWKDGDRCGVCVCGWMDGWL